MAGTCAFVVHACVLCGVLGVPLSIVNSCCCCYSKGAYSCPRHRSCQIDHDPNVEAVWHTGMEGCSNLDFVSLTPFSKVGL